MQAEFNEKMDALAGNGESFAVALSGGGDSMALALLACLWARKRGAKLVALTVDNGLRGESAKEAKWVAGQMSARKIPHEILTYEGKIPTRNIEESARRYRYEMLVGYCRDRGIPALIVAHNMDEQAETFLMNISRGSGVRGLAAMAQRFMRDGVWVLRPLLSFPREKLRAFLRRQGQEWIEDPMNRDDRFKRARVRKALAALEIPADKIALCAMNAARAQEAIDFYAESLPLAKTALASAPKEVALRALAARLKKAHSPRLESLLRLLSSITGPKFKAATLGGYRISADESGMITLEEEKRRK